MAIKVQILPKCEDCPYFEAQITRLDSLRGQPVFMISCDHLDHCDALEIYLRRILKKEESDGRES